MQSATVGIDVPQLGVIGIAGAPFLAANWPYQPFQLP